MNKPYLNAVYYLARAAFGLGILAIPFAIIFWAITDGKVLFPYLLAAIPFTAKGASAAAQTGLSNDDGKNIRLPIVVFVVHFLVMLISVVGMPAHE